MLNTALKTSPALTFAGKLRVGLTEDTTAEPNKLLFNEFCQFVIAVNRYAGKPINVSADIALGKEASLDYTTNQAAGHFARGWLTATGIQFDEIA